jgi:hypothetical protein
MTDQLEMASEVGLPKLVAGLGLWAWGKKPQAGQAQQQWHHCLVACWGGEDMVKAVSLVTWADWFKLVWDLKSEPMLYSFLVML